MCTPKKFAVITCAALKPRIQSPKCWCAVSYMPMATGTGYTIKNTNRVIKKY